MDRTNDLRTTLESDQLALGAKVTTYSPAMIEVYGGVGLDYAWLDLEHAGPSPYDSETMAQFSRVGKEAGVEPLVRVPSEDPHLIRKVLDAGIHSLLIPRIETADEVRTAIRAARFVHESDPGDRGIGIGRSSRFGQDFDNHVAREDREVLIGVMIENETAVDNLEDILTVPELGFIFVGPADLSVSMGRPLEKEHAAVQESIETIRDAAIDANVPIGCIADSPDRATRARTEGYSMLRIGGDVDAAATILKDRASTIRNQR
jgi:2-keto-3-deoxy-L-rhamnonate aldolase RhmA